MPKKGDLDTCLHCRKRLTYGPYYRQGQKKPTKEWTHPEGSITCLTKPEGWEGMWPVATPLSGLP